MTNNSTLITQAIESLNDFAREAKPGDISTFKQAIVYLPDYLEPNQELCKVLDTISAIIFHLVSPMRERVAEEWFEENYIPSGNKATAQSDRMEGRQLLLQLGLIPKIVRRL